MQTEEEFYVYDYVRDQWLQDDEHSFGVFDTRAKFTTHDLTTKVAVREARGRTGIIVLCQRVEHRRPHGSESIGGSFAGDW